MKYSLYFLLIVLAAACSSGPASKDISSKDSTNLEADTSIDNYNDEETPDSDFATYFVVVADTNVDYYTLNREMYHLGGALNLPIDTMGRYFNTSKDLIALPENDEDEIYAGDYFPRRFPSEFLSLEYLNFYQRNAGEKTIALVVGIYEKETSADSALIYTRELANNSFKIKADIYVGCMH